jgi:hypothetical protein
VFCGLRRTCREHLNRVRIRPRRIYLNGVASEKLDVDKALTRKPGMERFRERCSSLPLRALGNTRLAARASNATHRHVFDIALVLRDTRNFESPNLLCTALPTLTTLGVPLNSRVFLSCGQHSDEERAVAREVRSLLEQRGFDVYVAVDVQTLLEINARIIAELKNSDCFLLINFCREELEGGSRGSLFSNQEVAIAYALGFERLLVVNQRGIRSEGMLRYIGINTELFENHTDCADVVKRALDRSDWSITYSRRLQPGALTIPNEVITYQSPAGALTGRFVHLDIHNERPDVAALECVGRLVRYATQDSQWMPSPIRSPIKATGRPGFAHTIFPKSHEAFDLLVIGNYRPVWPYAETSSATFATPPISGISIPIESGRIAEHARPPIAAAREGLYLNSALDYSPMPCVPTVHGNVTLEYEFLAIGFPVLSVRIQVRIDPIVVQTIS